MKVSSIRWGVIWIGVGLFFLAINFELLDSLAFPRLFSLWPVLLVAIGVELIFRRSRLYFLALLSPLIIAGAFVVAASARGQWGWHAEEFWRGWGWRYGDKKTDLVEIPADENVRSIVLRLDGGQGTISLAPSSGSIFRSRTEYYRRGPWVKHSVSDSVEAIEFINREKPRFAFLGLRTPAMQNDFEIADYLPLKATITTNEYEPNLDFTRLRLTSANLNLKAMRTSIELGGLSDSVDISISGRSLQINLSLPRGFALAVVGDRERLKHILKDLDLQEGADGYYTPEYDSASRRLRLVVDADVKSLSISRD